jgi:hypothetical protein
VDARVRAALSEGLLLRQLDVWSTSHIDERSHLSFAALRSSGQSLVPVLRIHHPRQAISPTMPLPSAPALAAAIDAAAVVVANANAEAAAEADTVFGIGFLDGDVAANISPIWLVSTNRLPETALSRTGCTYGHDSALQTRSVLAEG